MPFLTFPASCSQYFGRLTSFLFGHFLKRTFFVFRPSMDLSFFNLCVLFLWFVSHFPDSHEFKGISVCEFIPVPKIFLRKIREENRTWYFPVVLNCAHHENIQYLLQQSSCRFPYCIWLPFFHFRDKGPGGESWDFITITFIDGALTVRSNQS